MVIAALAAAVETALRQAAIDGRVIALHQHASAVDIEVVSTGPLRSAQQRTVKEALRTLSASPRWSSATMLRIPFPITVPAGAAFVPCVPVLRRRRTLLWWPLPGVQHILLAADAQFTLAAMLGALTTVAAECPLTFLLHDPDGELRSLVPPQMKATPDALATARLRSLQVAWATHHQQSPDPLPPLVLIVIAPDAIVWRDLAPLLAAPAAGVYALVLLAGADGTAEVREACHRMPVIEAGGIGAEALPESHRLPGMAPPRADEVLAWQSSRRMWRGMPICTTPAALTAEWWISTSRG